MVLFSVTCLKTYPEPHNEGVFCDVFEDLPGTPCWVFCDVSGSYWDINFFNKKRWVLQYLISIKVQRQIHYVAWYSKFVFEKIFLAYTLFGGPSRCRNQGPKETPSKKQFVSKENNSCDVTEETWQRISLMVKIR